MRKSILLVAWTIVTGLSCALTTAADTVPRTTPNVLIILADDLGYSDLGCYGGEIKTPNVDRLAADGLRFAQFYNTARCWPTRSALMSGYYAQQVNMDGPQRGKPWPVGIRTLPQWLKDRGYRSYHSGKWHVMNRAKPVADAGFDLSYQVDDQDRHFSPRRHHENDKLLPAMSRDAGYYATTAIADHAIRCLKQHATEHANRPFFHYLAFTVPHFPLMAPAEDIARYRDQYLAGWDAVREERMKRLIAAGLVKGPASKLEPTFVPRNVAAQLTEKLGAGEIARAVAWSDLNEEQRRFQASKMAVHAAMVDRMDREIGRVLDQLRAMNVMEDTVIFFLSDNGASAEMLVRGDLHDRSAPLGSAESYISLGPGWSSAANTPFRRHKIWVHEGGISTPLVVHWPKGIAAHGAVRQTPGHVIDIVPTVLDVTGGVPKLPADVRPFAGRSLVPAFSGNGLIEREFLFFQHEGNRALRMGDWKLVSAREESDAWELYDLAADRAESRNLAAEQPDRVRAMSEKWVQLNDSFAR